MEARCHWTCLNGSDSSMEVGANGPFTHGSVPSMEARCHWTCLHGSDSFMEVGANGPFTHGRVPSMEARCHWTCFHGSDSFMEVSANGPRFHVSVSSMEAIRCFYMLLTLMGYSVMVVEWSLVVEGMPPWNVGANGHSSVRVAPSWR
ncbi:hypothetical protein MRB53_020905 [Persea americana]|uniref:Uncharacterized protein n=1 Tax=Persea americana TaxID=3435 RepID=A0ACC2L3J8_PERAE|nr:hypothetical protein MRB53_020905 [Persea americana]